MDPLFLTLEEILEIHRQQIERYGGSDGIRDAGALESAMAQPMASFGGEYLHPSIPAMAAAYLFHLCQNHPCIDGNKRTGANSAITFLFLNDWDLDLDEDGLVEIVLAVAGGGLQKPELIAFFELHCRAGS